MLGIARRLRFRLANRQHRPFFGLLRIPELSSKFGQTLGRPFCDGLVLFGALGRVSPILGSGKVAAVAIPVRTLPSSNPPVIRLTSGPGVGKLT